MLIRRHVVQLGRASSPCHTNYPVDRSCAAIGREDAPGIHEIDPVTGSHRVLAVLDPHAVQVLGLSVTDRYVF
jgi:hypothetical protein